MIIVCVYFFFFQAEDGIRDYKVTGVQTCALPISEIQLLPARRRARFRVPRQVRGWIAHGVRAGRARLSWIDRRTGESEASGRFCRYALPEGLGGIRETRIWRTRSGASL